MDFGRSIFVKAQSKSIFKFGAFLGMFICIVHHTLSNQRPSTSVPRVKIIPVPSCLCKPIKFILLSFSRAKSPYFEVVSRQ